MVRRKTKTQKKAGEESVHPAKRKKHVLSVKVNKAKRTEPSHKHENAVVIVDKGIQQQVEKPRLRVKIYENNRNGSDYDENLEVHKNYVMWSGVGFFMLLIVFIWILNVKSIIKAGSIENRADGITKSSLTDELNKNLEDIKKNLDDLKEVKSQIKDLKDYTGSVTTTLENVSGTDTSTPPQPQAVNPSSQKTIQQPSSELDNKLEILEKTIEATPGMAPKN